MNQLFLKVEFLILLFFKKLSKRGKIDLKFFAQLFIKVVQMSKSANSNLIPNLYKSRNILLEILKMRGFDTEDYANFSINEISKMNTNQQLDMIFEREKDGKKVYIKYWITRKLGISHVHEITDDLFHLETILTPADDLIILTKDKPNDSLHKIMQNLYKTDKIYFTIFGIKNLLYNILKHEMVPPHRIMEEDEIKPLLKKYNISNKDQLPEIDRFDPVAMLIGLRPGQIVEITRPSKIAISAKYYRLCY